jgi:hypothetical protein
VRTLLNLKTRFERKSSLFESRHLIEKAEEKILAKYKQALRQLTSKYIIIFQQQSEGYIQIQFVPK